MKKKLTSLLLALLATVGAWAIDVKIAETSSGLPTAAGFGSFSGQVFTTAEGSGLEQLLKAISSRAITWVALLIPRIINTP